MKPTIRLLYCLAAFVFAGSLVGLCRAFFASADWLDFLATSWMVVFLLFVALVIFDGLWKIRQNQFSYERLLPGSFSLNRRQRVQFTVENNSVLDWKVSLTDVVPDNFEVSNFPLEYTIKSGELNVFQYHVMPKKRGEAVFDRAYLLFVSRLGLWHFVYRVADQDHVRVYPDFRTISDAFVLGFEQNMRYMGAHIARRKGDGMEFNQLREFRLGDTLKQVDWKATARLGMPISKEYQEEKDQNIIFLLDSSRRMRAVEEDLSYFDYALNALLVSSYIALDKGDAVGVMTFSGEPSWLPPLKGKAGVNRLLNHLYTMQTSTQSSDYIDAAEQLLKTHNKRSLIILVTNVRDEDDADLYAAVKLLRKHHVVMVVALQESILSQIDEQPVVEEKDALLFASVKHFSQSRAKMLNLLRARGVPVVDATHKNLHVKLISEYLLLKQSGRI